MAQGIAFNKEKIIQTLKPYLKLGCNLKKACSYAGIPYTTVHNWVKQEEELRIQITAWQNELNNTARKNLANAIQKGDVNISMSWLSKKEKDEFSDRIEQTGAEGNPLFDNDAIQKAKQAISSFRGADTGGGE